MSLKSSATTVNAICRNNSAHRLSISRVVDGVKMLRHDYCEACAINGTYIFPNGEEMCRKYYDYIINEYELLSKLGLNKNVDN